MEKVVKETDLELFNKYKNISLKSEEQLLEAYDTRIDGLSDETAKRRLKVNGNNIIIKDEKKSWLYFLLISFKDQFIIILLFLAIINFGLGDALGSLIIVIIAFISALIRFYQDYATYKFNQKLKAKIYSSAIVLRDNKEVKVKTQNVVSGDIVKLNAGSIIPADLIILENKDLFLNQSVFTGESVPVEKTKEYNNPIDIFDISNICYMNSSVISGSATGLVINTGFNTYIGMMGKDLDGKHTLNNFEKGMNNITKLLIKYMVFVCLFVLIVDGVRSEERRV